MSSWWLISFVLPIWKLAIFMLFIPYCKQAQLPRPPLDFAVCRAGELGRDARLQKQIIWKKTSRLQGWLLRASHFGAFGGNHFEGLMSWCFIFAEKAMSCLLPRKPNRNMICKWLEVTIPTTQWLTMLDPFDPHRYHFLGPEKWDETWTTWFPVAKPMKFPVILFEYFTVWFKDCHRDNQIIDILVNPFGAIRSISVAPHKLTPCGRKGIWCVGPGGQSHKEVSNLSHRSAGWLCSVCWFSLKPIFTDEKSDIAYNLGVRAIVSYSLKQVLDKTWFVEQNTIKAFKAEIYVSQMFSQ